MTDKIQHMNSTSLQPYHIIGMNCDIRQESQLLDHKIIIYTAGQLLVKTNLEENVPQHPSLGLPNFSRITAICLSTKRKYLCS